MSLLWSPSRCLSSRPAQPLGLLDFSLSWKLDRLPLPVGFLGRVSRLPRGGRRNCSNIYERSLTILRTVRSGYAAVATTASGEKYARPAGRQENLILVRTRSTQKVGSLATWQGPVSRRLTRRSSSLVNPRFLLMSWCFQNARRPPLQSMRFGLAAAARSTVCGGLVRPRLRGVFGCSLLACRSEHCRRPSSATG